MQGLKFLESSREVLLCSFWPGHDLNKVILEIKLWQLTQIVNQLYLNIIKKKIKENAGNNITAVDGRNKDHLTCGHIYKYKR